MASPVRFETLDKSLQVPSGTVENWSKEPGFPLAGVGVALRDEVVKWQKSKDPSSAEVAPESPPEIAGTLFSNPPEKTSKVEIEGDVMWVTIRVPIVIDGPTLPGSNPVQALRIASSERHIKDTWGKVLHGCRAGKSKLMSSRDVRTSADSLKYVFEQICDAISKA